MFSLEAFRGKRVRYVEFEYHGVGFWKKAPLRNVTDELAAAGFTCYWQGRGYLLRITDCWAPTSAAGYGPSLWDSF